MPEPLIKDVSDTAFWVAIYRAIESDRTDALFKDPLARKLAGLHGQKIAESMNGSILSGWFSFMHTRIMPWNMAIRTRIIDDFILSAIADGADAVLNLGAGLDTRPYRMILPESFHWIEVDYPKLIDYKNNELLNESPKCNLERVSLDLGDIQKRSKLFSEIGSRFKNILVITEGVVPYLCVEDVDQLARDLKSQTTFRRWVVDYISKNTLRIRKQREFQRKMKNAPFLFDPNDYFGFFKEHGWRSKEIRYTWDEGEKLNRPMPLPILIKYCIGFLGLFVPKKEIEARQKFNAFVVFES